VTAHQDPGSRFDHRCGDHPADRLLLPGAGHFSRPTVTTTVGRNDSLVSGGTSEAVARGQRTAWGAMLGFPASIPASRPL
jgi:hypothetical protein